MWDGRLWNDGGICLRREEGRADGRESAYNALKWLEKQGAECNLRDRLFQLPEIAIGINAQYVNPSHPSQFQPTAYECCS